MGKKKTNNLLNFLLIEKIEPRFILYSKAFSYPERFRHGMLADHGSFRLADNQVEVSTEDVFPVI